MSTGKNLFAKIVTLANLASHTPDNPPVVLHVPKDARGCAHTRQLLWALTMKNVPWYRATAEDSALGRLLPPPSRWSAAPVLQIGAQLHLDTRSSLAELERRFPRPTLFPGPNADSFGQVEPADSFGAWADELLRCMAPALAQSGLSQERERYYSPDGFLPDDVIAEIERQLAMLERHLDGRAWIRDTFRPHIADLYAASAVGALAELGTAAHMWKALPRTKEWLENLAWFIGEEDPVEDIGANVPLELARRFSAGSRAQSADFVALTQRVFGSPDDRIVGRPVSQADARLLRLHVPLDSKESSSAALEVVATAQLFSLLLTP